MYFFARSMRFFPRAAQVNRATQRVQGDVGSICTKQRNNAGLPPLLTQILSLQLRPVLEWVNDFEVAT